MIAPADSSELSVRLAGPRDAALVARLLHAFNVEFEAPTPTAAEFETRFEVLLWRDDVRVWLAETATHPGGVALGFLLATHRPSPYHPGGIAQVEELYAVPTRRGTGVGTALMAALDAWVARHEVGEVHINVDEDDEDARRFYERGGFSHLDPTALAAGQPGRCSATCARADPDHYRGTGAFHVADHFVDSAPAAVARPRGSRHDTTR